jgi:DNA-binding NarL/FixJ family response regulator
MIELLIMSGSKARQDWLSKSVGAEPDVRVVATAPTFPFLRSLISDRSADILLIDLPADAQADAIRDWLPEFLERTHILLLIPEADPAIFNLIRHGGPGGVIQSDASADQIVQAIRSIASGLTVFDSTVLDKSFDDESPAEPLTAREIEVLQLLADGLGNRDIAARLGISEHTIKFHIRSILGKLGAASRTEAVMRGLRSGLIEL